MDEIDWNEPDDGETPEEMARARQERDLEENRQRLMNQILWEKYAGHYGRDGQLVVPLKFI